MTRDGSSAGVSTSGSIVHRSNSNADPAPYRQKAAHMSTDKKIPAGMAIARAEHDRIDTMPSDSGWQVRHRNAWHSPFGSPERPVRDMIVGWLMYADQHRERFGSTIGEDGVLGADWAAIGSGLLGLLNGETGRFDCGTLDAIIGNALEAEGFDRQGNEAK